ncbi:MAG: hypothetical protein KDI38_03575 [Calditrichaeota bacterium]|nr:hypothetical protein [Calditrichota bacterium]
MSKRECQIPASALSDPDDPAMEEVFECTDRAIKNFIRLKGIDPDTQAALLYIRFNITMQQKPLGTVFRHAPDGKVICKTSMELKDDKAIVTVSSRYLTPEDADEQQTATGTPG